MAPLIRSLAGLWLASTLAPAAVDSEFEAARRRGEAGFNNLACGRCHRLDDKPLPGAPDDQNRGPDLDGIHLRLSSERILRSMLAPNHEIAGGNAPQLMEDIALFLAAHPVDENAWSLAKDLESPQFEAEVMASQRLVLLDFWSETCLPCLLLEPVLDEISIVFAHRVNILRVEVEVETAISDEYVPDRILPCLVLFKDGKMIERRYGTNPEMEPKEFLQTWLSENLED